MPGYYESKGLNPAQMLLDILGQYGYPSVDRPVRIQSFEPAVLKIFHDLISKRSDLFSRPLLTQMLLADPGQPTGYNLTLLSGIATYANAIAPEKKLVITETSIDHARPTIRVSDLVHDAHAVGLAVHPWTLHSEWSSLLAAYDSDPLKEYLAFYKAGVDGVFTDFPDAAFASRVSFLDALVIGNLQGKIDQLQHGGGGAGGDDDDPSDDPGSSLGSFLRSILVVTAVVSIGVSVYVVLRRRRRGRYGYQILSSDAENRQLRELLIPRDGEG
eukprot:CAMPEP_0196664504 /NCGR_PEP_ID=MMETSP1086-20130531/57427_1 /TAXON_ID=77921 /ORGANISM="Cyanoptyche  gloeocystis , Strain SAG4.97" /LENGTH=271 /DNA_ID=CAMNT_0042000849 /DNA_START=98 /DNA_END=913 /DNA_ORIENTATION=-